MLYCKDTCGCRSVSSPSSVVFCIRLRNCFRLHHGQFAHGEKTINASFEEFKGKDTFFVSHE